jgi:hypothetical protein
MRYIAIKVKTTGNERQKKRNKVEKEERNEKREKEQPVAGEVQRTE